MSNKNYKQKKNGGASQKTIKGCGNDAPLARSGALRNTPPRISSSGNTFTISRREFVGTATNGASTSYVLSALSSSVPGYDLNPGTATMFPWLSTIAYSFERYRFQKLSISFVPSQSATTAGRYYAAVDFDWDDTVASSKLMLMGNANAVEAPMWQPTTMVVSPQSLMRDMPFKYVISPGRDVAIEPRTTFGGYLMVGFDTPTANCLIDIWVDYTVTFENPVNDALGFTQSSFPLTFATDVNITSACGSSNAGTPVSVPTTVQGAMKVVTPGASGIPSLSMTIGGAYWALTSALDILGAFGRGKLDLEIGAKETGVTPIVSQGTNLLSAYFAVYDTVGNYVGQISDALIGGLFAQGSSSAAALGAAAGTNLFDFSINLATLVTVWPTARYIAPVLFSTTACGAGTSGWAYKFY